MVTAVVVMPVQLMFLSAIAEGIGKKHKRSSLLMRHPVIGLVSVSPSQVIMPSYQLVRKMRTPRTILRMGGDRFS